MAPNLCNCNNFLCQGIYIHHQRGRGSVLLGAAFLSSNLGSSPSGSGAGKFAPFLFLGPLRAVYLSPPRCLTCSLGLAGCSVGRGISRGARKLARTPALSKKKKSDNMLDLNTITLMWFLDSILLSFACLSDVKLYI